MTRRNVIYTVTTHNSDILYNPDVPLNNFDLVAFADDVSEVPNKWRRERIPSTHNKVDARSVSRLKKIVIDDVLRGYDYSVYVDANIRIVAPIDDLLAAFSASGMPIAWPRHPHRTNIYDEVDACRRLNKLSGDALVAAEKQVAFYRASGLPDSHTLCEAGIMFRSHRHPDLDAFSLLWWQEFIGHAPRDQLSLPFAVWKSGITPLYWDWNARSEASCFRIHPHRGDYLDDLWVRLGVAKEKTSILTVPHLLTGKLRNLKNRFIRSYSGTA